MRKLSCINEKDFDDCSWEIQCVRLGPSHCNYFSGNQIRMKLLTENPIKRSIHIGITNSDPIT